MHDNRVYYDEDSRPNDAPGLKALALGCLMASCIIVLAVGTVLLLAFHH